MPVLDPYIPAGACDRCGVLYNLCDLKPDGATKGLLTCYKCNDKKNPLDIPRRARAERIAVPNARPMPTPRYSEPGRLLLSDGANYLKLAGGGRIIIHDEDVPPLSAEDL